MCSHRQGLCLHFSVFSGSNSSAVMCQHIRTIIHHFTIKMQKRTQILLNHCLLQSKIKPFFNVKKTLSQGKDYY